MTAVTEREKIVYATISEKFPRYVQVQRTPGIISGKNVTFNAHRFTPNFLLKAKAYIKWNLQIRRQRFDGVAGLVDEDYNVFDVIQTKPWDVISNSTSNISIRYNSDGITYQEPKSWSKYIGLRNAGRTNTDKYFSTQGGSFPDYNGVYNLQGQPQEVFVAGNEQFIFGSTDSRLKDSIDQSFDNYRDSADAGSPVATFEYIQHLNGALFNPFADVKDSIYKGSVYRKMTDLIPYVKEVEVKVSLENYSANSLQFLYGAVSAGGVNFGPIELLDDAILSAQLYLVWVHPKLEVESAMLPSMRFQSWYMDHRAFPIAGTINPIQTARADLQNLVIHQIPSAITCYTTVSKESTSYVCRSVAFDARNGGTFPATDAGISPEINASESNMKITNFVFRINLMGGDDVLDANYSSQELYKFTTKNSHHDYPFNYQKWSGGSYQLTDQPGQSYVLLAEDDLNAFKIRSGQRVRDFVMNFSWDASFADGYSMSPAITDDAGSRKEFKHHIVFWFDKYYFECNNDEKIFHNYETQVQ